ncbi:hypothetical protein BSR55_15550 [Acinetobacter bereziniae]|nr:hypothetical protein BSR55_15550 [Acinetobacter bereziniae]
MSHEDKFCDVLRNQSGANVLLSNTKKEQPFRVCGHFINGLRCRLKLSRYEEYTPQGNEENSETIFKFHNVA